MPFSGVAEKNSNLYELLREIKHQEDEWMYQLQNKKTEATTSETITKAFELAIANRLEEAASSLQTLAMTDSTPLVDRLTAFCSKAK